MNIPNTLTLFRVFLAPIYFLFFFSNTKDAFIYSAFIFFLAGLTDILDGFIARRHNMITKWGTVLDPLADKIMLLSVLICFASRDYIPMWVFMIIACKEIFMITGGIYTTKRNIFIPSNFLGKLSTSFFYLYVLSVLLDLSISIYILYLATALTVTALLKYIFTYFKISQKAM